MTFSLTVRRVLLASIALALLVPSAFASTENLKPALSQNPLLRNTRPWCIGRLLIDRPLASSIKHERYEFWGNTLEIQENVVKGIFDKNIADRDTELREKKRINMLASYKEMGDRGLSSMIFETTTPWLERTASPQGNTRIWIFKDNARSDTLFEIEGSTLAGSTMLTARTKLGANDIQRVLDRASDMHKQISYRDDWSVPAERGFCVKGALIGGPSRNNELVIQSISLMPDANAIFVIETRDSVEPDQQSSLLRLLPNLRNQIGGQNYDGNLRVLREGTRQVANTEAEEVLFSIQHDGAMLYRFYLIAAGNPTSTAQPHMEIRLLLGQQPSQGVPLSESNSPVDEATAIKTWDSLLDSLRLRPGAM